MSGNADIIASMRSLAAAHTKKAEQLTSQRRLATAGWHISIARYYVSEALQLEQSAHTEEGQTNV